MRSSLAWLKRVHGSVRVWLPCVLAALVLAPACLWAAAPAWWAPQGVLNTAAGVAVDDYAVANQGQVKSIARKAYLEMQAQGLIQPNSPLTTLVTAWGTPGATTDDYAVINLGQLKNVAEPFYVRLVDELGYTGQPLAPGQTRPWSGTGSDDYALANIGQVKNLFSFSIVALITPVPVPGDLDGDGIPDDWEIVHGFNSFDPSDGPVQLAGYQAEVNTVTQGLAPDTANAAGLLIYTP